MVDPRGAGGWRVVTGTGDTAAGSTPQRLLSWFVWLVVLHSVAVGAVMVATTEWAVAFGGWPTGGSLFFARQFGVFHFVVATAYAVEYVRYRGVTILMAAKAMAVASLGYAVAIEGALWPVWLAAAGDAVMGLAAWVLHGRAFGASALLPARTPPAPDRTQP
jgi:hypothetical protein